LVERKPPPEGAGVTKRSATLALLGESEARFRTLAETAPCAIFIYQGGRVIYANAFLEAMSGYGRADLEAMSFWDLVHADFQELVKERTMAPPADDGPRSVEFKVVRKDGQEVWVSFASSIIEHAGRPATLGIAFDITERKRAEERVRNLAYHDPLTGLPNRRLFNDRLAVALAQAHRRRQPLAVLFLDLDHFKLINDSFGHGLGDLLLQRAALRLIASVREGDTVARLGGDEFILLLPGLGRAEDVGRVAEKVLDALRQPLLLGERELTVSASMGISVYPDDGADVESLVKNADAAMYRAKDKGRDRFEAYTPEMTAAAGERGALEGRLRHALERGELVLHFQPVMEVASRRVRGVEALLRWKDPDRGLLLPEAFLPTAEVTGIIVPIGAWVLRCACARALEWQRRGHLGLHVAVNLSARQFQQADLVDEVRGALAETGLDPPSLHLEITEACAVQGGEAAARTLGRLKELGVVLVMDDFGVSYSSLPHLKRLPLDELKIDQSFVRGIPLNSDYAAVAAAVIAVGHTLGLQVVAEGVETSDQLAFLASRRCDSVQGWLLSPPLPEASLGRYLESWRRQGPTAD
jgi:diguanylate cyclase (GGDEF)-like protein/PAS domain S-box-containing protein